MTELPPIHKAAGWLYHSNYLKCIDDGIDIDKAYTYTISSMLRRYKDEDEKEIRKSVDGAKEKLLRKEQRKDDEWDKIPIVSGDTLNNEIKFKMLWDTMDTADSGLEHGFVMCADNGNISAQESCVGDECSVDVGEGSACKHPYTRHIGDFHTHPEQRSARDDTPLLSLTDMSRLGQLTKLRVKYTSCVSDLKEPYEVLCYTSKRRVPKKYNNVIEWFFGEVVEERIPIEQIY